MSELARLVENLEMAAEIAYPPMWPKSRIMVDDHPYLEPGQVAQIVADFWAKSWLREEVDAELFALEHELAMLSVPDDPGSWWRRLFR